MLGYKKQIPKRGPLRGKLSLVSHRKAAAISAQVSAFDSDTVHEQANMRSKLLHCFLHSAMKKVVKGMCSGEALATVPAPPRCLSRLERATSCSRRGTTGAGRWARRPTC